MRPVATLTIVTRPTGALLYELRDVAGVIVWESLGNDSESGRERVRSRLRAWLQTHPYKVESA